MIATVQKQFPGFSQQEAAQTVAETAQQFLEDHVEPSDRQVFAECFDSFTDGLKEKLLRLLIQHGTRGDWRTFYETKVKPRLTLSEAVEIADLLE